MLKDNEDIRNVINLKYSSFEYVGGYTGCDGKLILKCRKCGHEFEYTSQVLRPSKKYNIQCKECNKREKELEKLREKQNGEKTKYIKQQRKKFENELKRKEKLNNRICSKCGRAYDAKNMNQKYCSNECVKKHKNRVKEINRRKCIKSNGIINWNISLDKLIKRDNNICHICGEKCNKKEYKIINGNFIVGKAYPSIDHIIPVSKGGTHTWDNIKLAHHNYNTIKSNKSIYEESNGQLVIAI